MASLQNVLVAGFRHWRFYRLRWFLMSGNRRKGPREKDLTSRYFSGHYDEDRALPQERFTDRNKNAEQNRLVKTAQLRADAQTDDASLAALPVGEVIQVYSRY